MHNRKHLAMEAAAKALQIRKQLSIPLNEPASPLDNAENLGIEVRMIDIPSMEGMYVGGNRPNIILSTLRPKARQNFTCAHEIGHHVFNHGEQFDELVADRTSLRKDDTKEFIADCFAAYFLMPKTTVDGAMKSRGFNYRDLQPIQIYLIANWFGVGYRALISHLRFGLSTISHEKMQALYKSNPHDIRRQLLGLSAMSTLQIIDENWVGRAIDCEVGDQLLMPSATNKEGSQLTLTENLTIGALFQATSPGVARVTSESLGWSAFVRCSPKNYTGRGCFRFEEMVEE